METRDGGVFCWILDESNNAFAININDDDTVYDLKKAIVAGSEHSDLAEAKVRKTCLWKVPVSSSERKEIDDEKLRNKRGNQYLLRSSMRGSEVLSRSPHEGYIVAEIPNLLSLKRYTVAELPDPPLKRRRVDENPDANLCKLYDLFWGKPGSSLYQTFKVNIPHPMTLEVEEGEGSDFTVIKLPEGVSFPFQGSIMLVPGIYQTFWDLVLTDDADWQSHQGSLEPFNFETHSTIIMGQPGIGKSVLADNMLIRRLEGKMVTIFCDHPRFAHVFSADGVRKVHLTDISDTSIPDANLPRPPSHFYPSKRKGRVVVATSPNTEHLRGFSKQRRGSIYFMPTCDWDDLFCSCLLSLGNLTLQYSSEDCKRIRGAYAWFGGIKRRCNYHILSRDRESSEIVEIDKAIDGIDLVPSTTGQLPFKLVNIEPVDGSGWRRRTTVSLIRGEISRRVFERLTHYRHMKASESITRALGLARGFAGSLFKHAVHRMFRPGISFQPRGVTPNALPFDIKILKVDKEGDGYFFNLSVRARKGSQKVDPKYLDRCMVPISRTKESVDSVWISKFCTVFFQITVSPTHAVKLHGIMELQLPADATKDVRIVSILPANDEPTKNFKDQKIDRPAGVLSKSKVTIAEEVDKFPQYVHYVDLGSFN